jgi:hypothetical protein
MFSFDPNTCEKYPKNKNAGNDKQTLSGGGPTNGESTGKGTAVKASNKNIEIS